MFNFLWVLSLTYASALAACRAYTSCLRRFKHLYLCAGWHVCFAGDVEQMAVVTTHTSARTFVSGLRRVEGGLPLHRQTSLKDFVSIRQRLSPAGCAAAVLSPLSHPETLRQLSAPEEEFNPIRTAADRSGDSNRCGDSVSCLLPAKQVTIPSSTAANHQRRSQKMQVHQVDQSQCL